MGGGEGEGGGVGGWGVFSEGGEWQAARASRRAVRAGLVKYVKQPILLVFGGGGEMEQKGGLGGRREGGFVLWDWV